LDILNSFQKHQSILNRSSTTIKSYSTDISQFVLFISDLERDLKKITSIHLRYFIAYLSEKNLSKKSISRKISSLRSFFKFLLSEKYIISDPTYALVSPKADKHLPSVITLIEFDKIVSLIDNRGFSGKRDLSMLELLYSSGIRSSELLNIRENDLYLKDRYAKVMGKGSKERIIFFSLRAQKSLSEYIKLKKQKFPENRYLFLNKNGSPLSSRFLRKLVENYSIKANIPKKVTPHTFRHSFASSMLDKGVDLKLIQEFLGHSSISSTQIYTHVSKEELRKSYIKYAQFK